MDDSHNRSTPVISIYHPTPKTFTRLTSQETDFELGKPRFDAVPLRPDSVTIYPCMNFRSGIQAPPHRQQWLMEQTRGIPMTLSH